MGVLVLADLAHRVGKDFILDYSLISDGSSDGHCGINLNNFLIRSSRSMVGCVNVIPVVRISGNFIGFGCFDGVIVEGMAGDDFCMVNWVNGWANVATFNHFIIITSYFSFILMSNSNQHSIISLIMEQVNYTISTFVYHFSCMARLVEVLVVVSHCLGLNYWG